MKIGVPKETWPGELRAALAPASVKKLAGLGFEITVEAGLGNGSRVPDGEYTDAGATVSGDRAQVMGNAEIVLRVRKPETASTRKIWISSNVEDVSTVPTGS